MVDLTSNEYRASLHGLNDLLLIYQRSYFTSFKLRRDRQELWPLLHVFYRHAGTSVTYKDMEYNLEDYGITLKPFRLKSRILDLARLAYVELPPEIEAPHDIKSKTAASPTAKLSRRFEEFARGLVGEIGTAANIAILDDAALAMFTADEIIALFHGFVVKYHSVWKETIADFLAHLAVREMSPSLRVENGRYMFVDDSCWLSVLCAWQNFLEDPEMHGFAFDDLIYWINRYAQVSTEGVRDVVRLLSQEIGLFVEDRNKSAIRDIYRLGEAGIAILAAHSEKLADIQLGLNIEIENLRSRRAPVAIPA